MQERQFILRNLGMNRDLSVSKVGESSAYENRNIRIIARDKDTLLSVTNERGTKEIPLDSQIEGTIIGWNVLNEHLILFTHQETEVIDPEPVHVVKTDRIYRFDFVDGVEPTFKMTIDGSSSDPSVARPLFTGDLGFAFDSPIESIVSEESDTIKKIYWVDGKNVLRFLNFTSELRREIVYDVDGTQVQPYPIFVEPWEKVVRVQSPLSHHIEADNTYFDSNRAAAFSAKAAIEKDNSGNNRPNGVVQYLLTYFNKHGQESGCVWVSDLVYLSPFGCGGAADETNSNRVSIRFSDLDTSFSHFRVYSVFRSSLDGQTVAYLVSEQNTSNDDVTVIDDGAHLVTQDPTRLLYLGSQNVKAGTMAQKDQTLFLGDLKSIGRNWYEGLETVIRANMFEAVETEGDTPWESSCVLFAYSNNSTNTYDTTGKAEVADIPYVQNTGNYPYDNQLKLSSSQILTFKGGEKYRFALKFQLADGMETDAFWIGDKENSLYPSIDTTTETPVIKRVVAVCTIPSAVLQYFRTNEIAVKTVRLCIAEATYADRSVKAQGFINPTMFNTWERYNNRLYSIPSWISRPRGSSYPSRHFSPLANSGTTTAEIQCNYWTTLNGDMVPYYRYTSQGKYEEDFVGEFDFTHVMLVYGISWYGEQPFKQGFEVEVRIITAQALVNTSEDTSVVSDMLSFSFQDENFKDWEYISPASDDGKPGYFEHIEYSDKLTDAYGQPVPRYRLRARFANTSGALKANFDEAAESAHTRLVEMLTKEYKLRDPISLSTFKTWCNTVQRANLDYGIIRYCIKLDEYGTYLKPIYAMNITDGVGIFTPSVYRWSAVSDFQTQSSTGDMTPAYRKKHIMFIDENVVTLDSPELALEAVRLDDADLNFRIVGAVKMSSVMSDFVIDASKSAVTGSDYDYETFSGSLGNRDGNISGILTWPLWKEYGLHLKDQLDQNKNVDEYALTDYDTGGSSIVRYWMYMWHHSGVISGYNSYSEEETRMPSILHSKTFANLRFGFQTLYRATPYVIELRSLRVVDELSHSYNNLKIGSENRYYEADVQLLLAPPSDVKYPLLYSNYRPDNTFINVSSDQAFLSSNAPVLLEYRMGTHAVLSFKTTEGASYTQRILPYAFASEALSIPGPDSQSGTSGAIIPWLDYSLSNYKEYSVDPGSLCAIPGLTATDQYLFIGELYKDFSSGDTRYGGISASAVQNNRFLSAGPAYELDIPESGTIADVTIYGNEGDTYFQRWDCLRTKPFNSDSENKVIDITSVMLETHINLDGRTDLQRGIAELASIDIPQYGAINPVYSQKDNFSVRRDLDEDFNTDSYRSTITWTLQKADMADVDEWTHITLANTLKLDADKGICTALRRFQNTILAFQDRAISEVMFNSRTQVSTQDGVPVEIANSGKVDGKRYISNKYGCTNKWSIVEGKAALYFVDNINKAFCGFGGNGIDNLSEKLGFGAWFRGINKVQPWEPVNFRNIVSFYDRIHSDVYLVKNEEEDHPSLVYNELLGRFTSFFDYGSVPMMANIQDHFVSAHKLPVGEGEDPSTASSGLWFQNEGDYCDFFGTYKPFSVQYRVTPDPYGDKIWTNVEYRADFYKMPDTNIARFDEQHFIDEEYYQPYETFDYMRFWNEYQTTIDEANYNLKPVKKFRVWRLAIPRAVKSAEYNRFGLDRIRNPWLNLLFKKNVDSGNKDELVQLHDITVKYFE